MESRWNIPDSVFDLSLQFYKEALKVVRDLMPAKVDSVMETRLAHLQELSQLLDIEWRRSFPIKHQHPKELTSMPILN
ncbi:MAG: hypothetical protein D4R93_03430 [Deltaproteobacteria bacterium]|nr:MAG: hypothetical protein D4R93_03430 [Deltaproteobacteria bacterium]